MSSKEQRMYRDNSKLILFSLVIGAVSTSVLSLLIIYILITFLVLYI